MIINNSAFRGGYIALLSTIIISAVLLTMTVGAGQSGWFTRFEVLRTEAKLESQLVTKGCINEVIAKLINDPTWMGDTTITKNSGICYVYPIQKNYPYNNYVIIKVRGDVRNSVTNIISEFDMAEIYLDSSPRALPIAPPQSIANIIPIKKSLLEVGVMP